MYFASVIDLASRRLVGWSMADHMEASLVCDALKMAIDSRRPGAGLIFHSDRGSQLEFKDSSQHQWVMPSVEARRALRPGSSSRGSSVAAC